ncbi:MAG TPA: hypothetical protein VGC88_07645 [Terriglobales bacterium]
MAMKREDLGTRDVSPSDPEQEQARQDLGRIPEPKSGYPETAATTTPQQSSGGMDGGAGIGQGPTNGPARDKRHDKSDPDNTVKDRNVA